MNTKTCKICGTEKRLSEFYGRELSRDGLQSECKTCNSDRRKLWGKNNLEHRRKYNKRYYQDNREKIIENEKAYGKSEQGTKARRKAQKVYRKNHPDTVRAKNRLWEAIKREELLPAPSHECVDCGKQAEQYHHHKGYGLEHALDVVPMCRPCHRERHNQKELK